jgi:hypothetical protein
MAGKDGPVPTPEMKIAERYLASLTAPVAGILLEVGVDPLKAGFVALRCVQSVLEGYLDEPFDIDFVLDNQSFRI